MQYRTSIYIYTLLIIFLGCSRGQDENRMPVARKHIVTFENLFGVSAGDRDNAWLVGYDGIILHSGDGGKNWEVQKAPVKTELYDVCFVDAKRGWITGKSGTILHTTDGGKNWVQQNSHTQQRLFDAHFVDKETGWAVGTMGTILHTANGGETWVTQKEGEDRYYNGVFFVDENHGWVVGEYNTLYATVNGGKDWVEQTCEEIIPEEPELDFAPPPPHLYGVYFISPDTGWATGLDGIVIKTDDGGKNWHLLTTGAEYAIYKICVIGSKGWAIGDRGEYLASSDGGNTWSRPENKLRTKFWLKDMVFFDENNGWIVGAYGTILKTDDGGQNWNMLSGIFIQD